MIRQRPRKKNAELGGHRRQQNCGRGRTWFSVAANTGRNEVFGAGSLFSEAANAETVADGKIFCRQYWERSPKVQVLQLT